MPVRITAYACNHRCGFIGTRKKAAQKHEANCSMSPIKRGCGTCANFYKFNDSNGMHHDPAYLQEWVDAGCHEEVELGESTDKNPLGMVFDCKEWEAIK